MSVFSDMQFVHEEDTATCKKVYRITPLGETNKMLSLAIKSVPFEVNNRVSTHTTLYQHTFIFSIVKFGSEFKTFIFHPARFEILHERDVAWVVIQ